MQEKRMAEAEDARVMALLHVLTDNQLNDLQAETLYNDIAARILRVPAEYQPALGMQIVTDSGLPLSAEQAQKFITCVLYCVCYTDAAGTPGYKLVTLQQILQWHIQFQPFFADWQNRLEQLIAALRASRLPPQ